MQNDKATYNQISYLQKLYERGIGYCNSLWYVAELRKRGFTKLEASKEIERLKNIALKYGPTAVKPQDWEKINPDDETISKFMNNRIANVKVVVDDGK